MEVPDRSFNDIQDCFALIEDGKRQCKICQDNFINKRYNLGRHLSRCHKNVYQQVTLAQQSSNEKLKPQTKLISKKQNLDHSNVHWGVPEAEGLFPMHSTESPGRELLQLMHPEYKVSSHQMVVDHFNYKKSNSEQAKKKGISVKGKDKKKLDVSSFNEANSALSRGGVGVAGCIEEQGDHLSEGELNSENLEHGNTLPSLRPESYKLCHNNHLSLVLESLAGDESFMDVTLTAQGKAVKAHKSVLSAVSPYFRKVLKENPCQHPIIIMPRDIKFEELNNIIKYVYKGELTVAAEELSSLLKTGEVLQVAGLSSIGTAGVNPDGFIGQNQGISKGLYPASTPTVNSTNLPSFTSKITSKEPLYQEEPSSRLNENLPLSATRIEGSEKIDPLDFLKSNMVLIKEEMDCDDEEIEEYYPLSVDETEEYHPLPTDHKSCVSSVHASTSVECSASMRSSSPNGINLKINDLGNSSLSNSSPQENNLPAEHANKIFNPGEIFSTPSSQEESNASLATPPYVCPHCLETHRLNETLQLHLRLKHPSKPSFTCVCGRVFLKQNLLTNHKKKCDL